mgnify:CR=1 FL=1
MSVVSGQADTLTFADVEKKFTQLSKTFSSTEKILSMPSIRRWMIWRGT